jgi:hypothetical protein
VQVQMVEIGSKPKAEGEKWARFSRHECCVGLPKIFGQPHGQDDTAKVIKDGFVFSMKMDACFPALKSLIMINR